VRTSDFDYTLPPALIAQTPAPQRDQARLLILDRAAHTLTHTQFRSIDQELRPPDLLVLNDTQVWPARLHGRKSGSAGRVELLLVNEIARNDWWTLLRPGKRVRPATEIQILDAHQQASPWRARVIERNDEGQFRLEFFDTNAGGVGGSGCDITQAAEAFGHVPLPHYIQRGADTPEMDDRERYQTVYARYRGSAAAPTAGLHFDTAALDRLRAVGVELAFVTLHVGVGTFTPVRSEHIGDHAMHAEPYLISDTAAQQINQAKIAGRRIVAVGTTTLRVLETAASRHDGHIRPGAGTTRLFVFPPFTFRIVGALLTNFHLPRSTLLMLVSAFAAPGATSGRAWLLEAYAEAVRERYRFFSYGDAMFIR
jgi:S-adenosylmethionine:tRNA ribosyltransferase-isomerase